MTLGTQIALLRKQNNITQEALAQQLGVTNQAVSKWESDQCCPDVTLLPKIADIFHISIDTLFGRPAPKANNVFSFPWPDDNTLHVVLFVGHTLVDGHPAEKEITFHYEGPALNISSNFSVNCEDVDGNVNAGSTVNCEDVNGCVHAGGNVNCTDVGGPINAGGNITCEDVTGDVHAGGMAICNTASGTINSGKDMMKQMWTDMFPK